MLGPLALTALVLLPLGCHKHASGAGPSPTGRLFPLDEGMTWTFRLETADGQTMDLITRVDHVHEGVAHLTSGMTSYAYELREDGIFRPSMDAYLIKEPIREGSSWAGIHGGTVTVLASDETVSVPAGTFEGCVRVEEAVEEMGQSQIHTFCPGVGPVRLEQFVSGRSIARGELIAHGPTVELEDEPEP